MDKKLVKIGEAAAILGMSTSTLRRWESLGKLQPAHKSPGGARYYDVAEIKKSLPGGEDTQSHGPGEAGDEVAVAIRRELVFTALSGGGVVNLDYIDKLGQYVLYGKF